MSLIDVAAVIGALAWVPQIITWVRDLLAKPVISLFTANAPELGFSAYGTVLNLSAALSTSVTDAVVTHIEVELTHENGQKLILPWMNLSESLAQVQTPTGFIEHHRRLQPALALKVTTDDLKEKTVMFQDASFQQRVIAALRSVEDRREHVYATSAEGEAADLVLRSDEYARLESTVREGFNWQVGAYSVIFRVQTEERREPFKFAFNLQLSGADVTRLRENVDKAIASLRGVVIPSLAVGDPPFNWRYPTMLPVKTVTTGEMTVVRQG